MPSRRIRAAALGLTLMLVAAPWPGRAGTEVPPLLNRPRCGTAAGASNAGERSTLRVATFNILHGLEETPTYPTHSTFDARLELAVQAIAGSQIDLLGMQEVSKTEGARKHRSGLAVRRMASRLAQITGQSWHWCWALSNPHFPLEPDILVGGGGPISNFMATQASGNYASFKEGSAVLSRYPITAAESRRLPLRLPVEYVACPPDEIPDCNLTTIFDHRIALWARIAAPGGTADIVTAHFAHHLTPLSEASKYQHAVAVVAFADEEAARHGEPVRRFLTCDCNLTTEDTPSGVRFITDHGWTDTFAAQNGGGHCTADDRAGCTSDQDILASGSTTSERIDYVFARGGTCSLTLGASQKFADAPSAVPGHAHLWPSDHHAVWTDVVPDCIPGEPIPLL
jgi:endonuclease/exonuclease/phosphatase family metal-dependent hydrolase